jgi:hypothetical protein
VAVHLGIVTLIEVDNSRTRTQNPNPIQFMKAENKFGFPFQGTLEEWIGAQAFPERFKIVRLEKSGNGVEEEGGRVAQLDGVIVAEERVLPCCAPMVLPYRAKHPTKLSRVSRFAAGP